MGNEHWFSEFGQALEEILAPRISDHSPALISIGKNRNYGSKPFKFFNFLAYNNKFLDWVKQEWAIEVQGLSMFGLYCN